MTDTSIMRWCGLTGILGAALLLAADWTMLGTWSSGQEFNEKWHIFLTEMPRWRLALGGLAGPIGAWCYVVGFWQVRVALKPAGRVLAFVVFAGFSLSFVWAAAAFHSSFPLLADALRTKQAAAGNVTAESLLQDPGFQYFGMLFLGAMPPAGLACLLLAYAVLWKPTRYPRWFAALNPAVLFLLSAAFRWMPAPLGGPLVIGAGNLAFLIVFVCSTALLWNDKGDPAVQ